MRPALLTREVSSGLRRNVTMTVAMVLTTAVIAWAEVARPLRFLNILFGLWLIIAPWLLDGGTVAGSLVGILAGIALIALSLPRGKRSEEHYGSWDRFIV